MTTLQEAAKLAIEALTYCEALNSSMIEQKRVALNALRAALAQQGEQAKPVAYITQTEQGPMVWTTEMYGEACTYCDDGEFPIPLYTAAPAPQAQDKSDNYLSGYCTGRTDLLKEQSAQPVAQPLSEAAIREIADCIVSNLDSRKGVIYLDLDDDLVEEIMQEMCDTIAHGIREVK